MGTRRIAVHVMGQAIGTLGSRINFEEEIKKPLSDMTLVGQQFGALSISAIKSYIHPLAAGETMSA
jgi:hypothetical protein